MGRLHGSAESSLEDRGPEETTDASHVKPAASRAESRGGPPGIPDIQLRYPHSARGYLAMEAHKVVFSEQPELIGVGVYSWVRHPMYLGTLLFCLEFFLAIPSILALALWVIFFLIYDRMATYEETELRRMLGEEYAAYQKRVSRWFPRSARQN